MKQLILILCAVFALNVASAQPPMGPPPGMGGPGGPGGRRPDPAKRIERIKEQLGLTDEQAEKFAPVYLAYQRELSGIRKDLKAVMESYEGKEIDDKTAFRLVMAQLNSDADVIACKKEYMRVFKNYLTPEQLSKVFIVEKFASRPRGPKGGPGAPDGQGMPPMGPPPAGVPMP